MKTRCKELLYVAERKLDWDLGGLDSSLRPNTQDRARGLVSWPSWGEFPSILSFFFYKMKMFSNAATGKLTSCSELAPLIINFVSFHPINICQTSTMLKQLETEGTTCTHIIAHREEKILLIRININTYIFKKDVVYFRNLP